jgi:hypothetical protein
LVCKILTTDPMKRATLQDIVRHPWMTAEESADEVLKLQPERVFYI